jgi:hypothetical protein
LEVHISIESPLAKVQKNVSYPSSPALQNLLSGYEALADVVVSVRPQNRMAANDRFDKEAAEWDNNPFTVKSSQFALGALLENVPQLQALAGGSGEKSEYRPFLF